MTQSERREYLIQYLLKEERRLYGKKMPADKQGQENLLRLYQTQDFISGREISQH